MRCNRSLMALAFLLLALPVWAQNAPGTFSPSLPDRPMPVKVIGVVRCASTLLWRPTLRVSEALEACGGLVFPPADATATLITHGNRTAVPINLTALLKGGSKQNLLLAPGDTLLVARAETGHVYVAGEIAHPGSYAVSKSGASALALLAEAGGPKPDAAECSAQVLYQNRHKTYDLRPLPKNQTYCPPLVAGDTLLVPARGWVYCIGAVRYTSGILMPDGEPLTVAQALTMDDGCTPQADVEKLVILRYLGGKAPDRIPAGMTDELRAGDIVLVPSLHETEKARPRLIVAHSGEYHA